MSSPKVSVVIPAYNHEKFVGAAVDSVLGQTIDDLELIVIDDGSTDKTGEIVKSYTDPRIRYTHQENQDAFNALNHGIAQAHGEFVSILNSDDVYAPTRLERLVQVQKETGAQCLFTHVQPIDGNGNELSDPGLWWHMWHEKNRSTYADCGDLYEAFLSGNLMVTTSNLFLTAEALQTIGGFAPLRYLHDYDFIFRAMLAYPDGVHYMADEKLVYYRIHGSNTLSEGAVKARLEDQQVIEKYMLARLPAESKRYAAAGAARLVALERELGEVRALLGTSSEPCIKTQLHVLIVTIVRRLKKLFGK